MKARPLAGKGGRVAGCFLLLAGIGVSLRYDLALFHWQQGKERLAGGKPRAALAALDKAATDFRGSPELKLDAGGAHYRLGEFRQAGELFREALASRDPEVKGAALYNLGNCAYRLHLQKLGTDRDTARRLLQEAQQHYERSLALCPADDARYNLGVVRARLTAWERIEGGAAGKDTAASAPAASTSGNEREEKGGDGKSRDAREGERSRRTGREKGSDGAPTEEPGARDGAKRNADLGREEAEQMLNEARKREKALLPVGGGMARGESARPSKDW